MKEDVSAKGSILLTRDWKRGCVNVCQLHHTDMTTVRREETFFLKFYKNNMMGISWQNVINLMSQRWTASADGVENVAGGIDLEIH